MDRAKRLLRWAAWGALVLFVLGVVAWTVFHAVAAARLDAALRSLREAGIETSLVRMAPPAVPGAQNAGPLYRAAFELLPDSGKESEMPERPVAELSEAERAALRAWLAKHEDSFGLIARARGRAACDFGWDYGRGFAMAVPEIGPMVRAARALSLRAEFLAAEGDPGAAREAVRDILALADALADKPLLICALVRLVVLDTAVRTIASCVTAETPEPELRAWRELVPSRDVFGAVLEVGIRGELAAAAEFFQGPSTAVFRLGGEERGGPREAAAWLAKPLLKADGARHLERLAKMVPLSRRPYPEIREEASRLMAEAAEGVAWLRPVSRLLMPALGRAFERVALAEAGAELVRCGLETERVRSATAEYPDAVECFDPHAGRAFDYDPAAGWIRAAEARDLEWKLRRAGR